MSFGSRWAAILLFCACALARCVGAATLFGKVTDDAGFPVGDVQVLASNNSDPFSVRSDVDGNYTIPVAAGYWSVQCNGWELQARGLIQFESHSALLVEGENKRVDIRLTRAVLRLIANVRNTAGEPIEGTIRARREDSSANTGAQIVGGIGELRLTSGPWLVTVSALGGYKFPPRRLDVMSEAVHQIELTVEPQPTVEFAARLVDENGNGVSGISLDVRPIAHDTGLSFSARTDQNGAFSLTANAGDILFTPFNNALIPRTVLHAPTPGRYEHVIQMRRRTGEIVLRTAAPVSAAFIASTFSDGKFYKISGHVWPETRIPLFDADWQFSVISHGPDLLTPAPSMIAIRGQSEIIDLRFALAEASARIRGRVVDAQNKPVPFAPIRASRLTLGQLWQDLRTDGDGAFDFAVAPGDWRLSVQGSLPAGSQNANVFVNGIRPGETRDVGSIDWIWGPARVIVRLTDEAGEPLDTDWPYLRFHAELTAEHSRGYLKADAWGPTNEFVFDVAPGRWTFSANPFQLHQVGYAAVRSIAFEVTTTGTVIDVPIKRLAPGSEIPRVDIARRLSTDATVLSIFAEEYRPVFIETSSNLQDWRFHTFLEGSRELVMPRRSDTQFFRAITEY